MRISCIKDDPGYIDGLQRAGVSVTLNDQPVKDCRTADEERGFVVVLDRDDQGRPRLNHDRSEVRNKTLHGSVRITIQPNSWMALSLGDK